MTTKMEEEDIKKNEENKPINFDDVVIHKKETKSSLGIVLYVLAFIITLILLELGDYSKGGEIIKVGDVTIEKYISPREIVDEVATEKLRDAAANSVAPIYKNDTIVEERTKNQIKEVFYELENAVNYRNNNLVANTQPNSPEHDLSEIDETGNSIENIELNNEDEVERVNNNNIKNNIHEAELTSNSLNLSLPIVFTGNQIVSFAELNKNERDNMAETTIDIINEIYRQGVTAEVLEVTKQNVYSVVEGEIQNPELQTMAYLIISAALEPNLVLDEETMEIERQSKRAEVAEVLILKNQKIIDDGEIIDQETYDKLIALGLIGGTSSEDNIYKIIGNIIITILLFGFGFCFLNNNEEGETKLQANEEKMLFWIYLMMIILIRVLSGIYYYTIIPLELFAMLVSALISKQVALVFYGSCCIIGCLMFAGDVEFLVYSLISGFFGAVLIKYTKKRSQTVPVALGMAGLNFMTMMGVGLFFKGSYSQELFLMSSFASVMGLSSVIITMGSLPFWEEVFEANTPLYLLELTNPNSKLLRRMMIEAPATYHHSLLVANLAETATYAVNGNVALARVGAYYHDIGKLKSPIYFAENQSGYNPHDELTPEESAKIITGHTQDGYNLGLKHKLPKPVLNIMVEHHGDSLVKYFYFKALKLYGAENVDEEDYRYKGGRVPQSKESAIIMLADTTEAAVRAMLGKGKTLAETDEFIRGLIKDKLDDGQLRDSCLMIHELDIIRNAFMEVFQGMYHERVSYPKPEEITEAKESKQENNENENSKSTEEKKN